MFLHKHAPKPQIVCMYVQNQMLYWFQYRMIAYRSATCCCFLCIFYVFYCTLQMNVLVCYCHNTQVCVWVYVYSVCVHLYVYMCTSLCVYIIEIGCAIANAVDTKVGLWYCQLGAGGLPYMCVCVCMSMFKAHTDTHVGRFVGLTNSVSNVSFLCAMCGNMTMRCEQRFFFYIMHFSYMVGSL